jgi:hypothetical protein
VVYGGELLIKTRLEHLLYFKLFICFLQKDKTLKEENKVWLFVFGFLLGILGGAYRLKATPGLTGIIRYYYYRSVQLFYNFFDNSYSCHFLGRYLDPD